MEDKYFATPTACITSLTVFDQVIPTPSTIKMIKFSMDSDPMPRQISW